jgi:hypothetical protein
VLSGRPTGYASCIGTRAGFRAAGKQRWRLFRTSVRGLSPGSVHVARSMTKEPFDIGRLLPHGVTRIKLEIRLTPADLTIRVFAAEDYADQPSTAAVGKAVLWREDTGPVLISVPADVQVVAIDADAHE